MAASQASSSGPIGSTSVAPKASTPTSPPHASDSPSSSSTRNMVLSFLAGGFSGALAKTIVAPLDRIKILFQISHVPYTLRAVAQELQRTVVHEGFPALFRGNGAQVLRVYPYSGIQLMSFDAYSRAIAKAAAGGKGGGSSSARSGSAGDVGVDGRPKLTSLQRLLAGACAGATSVVITYPLDLMRARLAVQIEATSPPVQVESSAASSSSSIAAPAKRPIPRGVFAEFQAVEGGSVRYRNLLHAFASMHREHGLISFYRGMGPTLVGILPYAGISFASYETLKQSAVEAGTKQGGSSWLLKEGWDKKGHSSSSSPELSTLARLICGGIAGLCGQASTYPLDIVRRRMQTDGYTPIHAHAQPGQAQGQQAQQLVQQSAASSSSSLPAGQGAAVSFSGAAATAAAAAPQQPPSSSSHRPLGSLTAKQWRSSLSLSGRVQPRGMADTLLRIIEREGLRGLFKGLSMNFIKGPVGVGVSFTAYDLLKGTLGIQGAGGGHGA